MAAAFPHHSKSLDYPTYSTPRSKFWVSPAPTVRSLSLTPGCIQATSPQRLDHPGSPYLALALRCLKR